MPTNPLIAEVRAALEKASTRPWSIDDGELHGTYQVVRREPVRVYLGEIEVDDNDAHLIVTLVNNAAALCDALEDAESRLSAAEETYDEIITRVLAAEPADTDGEE